MLRFIIFPSLVWFSEAASNKACKYREVRGKNGQGEEAKAPPSKVEVMWVCPGPDQGNAVVTVNFRLRGEKSWNKLQHSLRESPLR